MSEALLEELRRQSALLEELIKVCKDTQRELRQFTDLVEVSP